jgi:hypothetical protein
MSAEYPKKYWWIVLIVIPILVTVIAGIFARSGKDEQPPQSTYNIDNSIDNSKVIKVSENELKAVKDAMIEIDYVIERLSQKTNSYRDKLASEKNFDVFYSTCRDLSVEMSTVSDYIGNVNISQCPKEFKLSVAEYRNHILELKNTLLELLAYIQKLKQDPFGMMNPLFKDAIAAEFKKYDERFNFLIEKVTESEKELKNLASKYEEI